MTYKIRPLFALCAALMLCGNVSAQSLLELNSDKQANSLINIYSTFCVKHMNDLKKLYDGMQLTPSIPQDKAAPFLQGAPGMAWYVPNPYGTFILAIRSDKPQCAVYAKRAAQKDAEQNFVRLVTAPSGTVKVTKTEDTSVPLKSGGELNTKTYEWKAAGEKKKMVFSLTTTKSDSVPVQAIATAVVSPQ